MADSANPEQTTTHVCCLWGRGTEDANTRGFGPAKSGGQGWLAGQIASDLTCIGTTHPRAMMFSAYDLAVISQLHRGSSIEDDFEWLNTPKANNFRPGARALILSKETDDIIDADVIEAFKLLHS